MKKLEAEAATQEAPAEEPGRVRRFVRARRRGLQRRITGVRDRAANRLLVPAAEGLLAMGPDRLARLDLTRAVRLGVWLKAEAPGAWARTKGWLKLDHDRPSPLYLFKEMLGLTRLDDPYLYVTDGGHFDNLGLIELLRRGCGTVFCLDAGGDPPGRYDALGEAVGLARSELNVDVDIDPTGITPEQKGGLSKIDHAVGRVRYMAAPLGGATQPTLRGTGRLVYCRAAVCEDAPWDVRSFRDRDGRFPVHSTFDQLFDDHKFESYRALGAHTASKAVRAWRAARLEEELHAELVQLARNRTTAVYGDLVKKIAERLQGFELPDLHPLLDAVAERDAAAGRPSLRLLVREAAEDGDAVVTQACESVWALYAAETNGREALPAPTP
jgi:hypothetical protein